jgi:hypothetical protein
MFASRWARCVASSSALSTAVFVASSVVAAPASVAHAQTTDAEVQHAKERVAAIRAHLAVLREKYKDVSAANIPVDNKTRELAGVVLGAAIRGDLAVGKPSDEAKEYTRGLRQEGMAAAEAAAKPRRRQDVLKELEPALAPTEFRPFAVQDVVDVSPNTKVLRIQLPKAHQQLGLTCASYLVVQADIDGQCLAACCQHACRARSSAVPASSSNGVV